MRSVTSRVMRFSGIARDVFQWYAQTCSNWRILLLLRIWLLIVYWCTNAGFLFPAETTLTSSLTALSPMTPAVLIPFYLFVACSVQYSDTYYLPCQIVSKFSPVACRLFLSTLFGLSGCSLTASPNAHWLPLTASPNALTDPEMAEHVSWSLGI